MENAAVDDTNADCAKLNAAVTKSLERILEELGARSSGNYDIENATAKGENYIGVVFRITAEAENESGQSNKIYCLVKVPPTSPARRKQFFARPCFLREAMAYEEFLPLVESFQIKHGIENGKQRFHEYPKCHGVMTAEYDEAIFMENMSIKGYKLFDRFKEMDIQHVGLVMRAYGKLHAVSLALKKEMTKEFQPFQSIVDIFEQRKDEEQMGNYFEYLKTTAFKALDAENDKSYYDILKQYLEKDTFFGLLLDCLKLDDCEPYAVICHGDCWNNNYLFEYDEHNAPTDVCVIDWQIMRYGSPVLDLMYFIFGNTTGEFRKKHYIEAINIYYDELSAHLERLGLNAQKHFPREVLDIQLKRKGAMGLLFAMIILPVITLKSEDTPDLEKLSEQLESGETPKFDESGFFSSGNSNSVEKRMRDVIVDIIEYGYIS